MLGQPVNLYWPSFFWGLLVLASFVGWGSAIGRFLVRPNEAAAQSSHLDWGLLAGWGMAWTLAVGGILAWTSLASRWMLVAFVLFGAGIWIVRIFHCPPQVQNGGHSRWGACSALLLLLLIWYAPAVALQQFNSPDDFVAYMPFARRLLESGTLLDPFSFRRLQSLGGQSLLHAITLCFGGENNANLLDCGLGSVMMAGLLFGVLRAQRLSLYSSIATVALLLLMPIPRANVMSQTTGVVLLFTLYRTLLPGTIPGRWQRLLVTGLAAAGVCALRSSFYIAAFIIVTGGVLVVETARPGDWRGAVASAAKAVAFAAAFVFPWMLLSYRSSNSLLYPFMRGTHQPGFEAFSAGLSGIQIAAFCAHVLTQTNVLMLLMASVAAALLYRRPLSLLMVFAALVTGITLAVSLTFGDPPILYRYLHPVLFAAVLAACSLPFGDAWMQSPRWKRQASMGVLILVSPYLLACASLGLQRQTAALASLPSQIRGQTMFASQRELQAYRQLQSAIPPSAALFAAMDKPSLLSYHQATVYGADVVGACSLPPGLPFFRGPAAVKSYFKAVGIEYVAYTDFEVALPLYNRRHWVEERDTSATMWHSWAPYFLDLMDNLDQLSRSERNVRRFDALRLIRLE